MTKQGRLGRQPLPRDIRWARGGFTVAGFAASDDIARDWNQFGRIGNLFDRIYEDPGGFQHPGIAGFAGLAATFGAEMSEPSKQR